MTNQNNEKIHNAISEVSKGYSSIIGQFLNSTCIRTNQSGEDIIYSAVLTEISRRQRRNTRTFGRDHNQLHFNIKIKSDKTKCKQCRRDSRKGNYNEIGKSLAHIYGNKKMKNKTATECWNILIVLLIVMFYEKARETVRRRNICQKRLSEILDKNKICGGFINIRERINIMRFTKRN